MVRNGARKFRKLAEINTDMKCNSVYVSFLGLAVISYIEQTYDNEPICPVESKQQQVFSCVLVKSCQFGLL